MSIPPLTQVLPVPTGINRLGFPTYGRLPGNVPNPPNAWQEAVEMNDVRILNARAHQSPDAVRFTEYLADKGGFDMWMDFAKQYRRVTGFWKGWAGTGMMLLGMGSAALRTQFAKGGYGRMRPYQLDASIRPIGKVPTDTSFPSGHTSAAYAAASVMASLWPARAHEYMWWANQVGLSRVHAGVHFPSDVQMGAQVGIQAGLAATSILRR